MPISLTVSFLLTDLDNAPIADAPVRVAFGGGAGEVGWRSAEAGQRFTTDAQGRHRFTTEVTIGRRLRKPPTNFWTSLVARPQWTDHLTVATELEFMTFPWLHVADINRFPGGDPVMLDGVRVYTRDAAGDFTVEARHTAGGWQMTELGGLRLTTPGHAASGFLLQPDEHDTTGTQWTLALSYKRWPAPEIR